MFNWLWRGKIRNTLLTGFLVLTLVPALAAIVAGYFYTTRSVTALTFENLQNLADTQSEFIETWFFERARFISYLAGDEEMKSLAPARIQPVLEKAREAQPDFMSLTVTDHRGVVIASIVAPPGTDLSGRPYMKAALEGYDYISEVVFSLVDQKPIVVLASPLRKDGRVAGAVLGVIDVERISREAARGYHGRTGEVLLVNRDGVMVNESRFTADLVARGVVKDKTSMKLKVNTPDVGEALQGRSGSGRYKDYRGVEVVSSYRWLPYIKMAVVAKMDYSEVMEKAGAAVRPGVAAAALVAVVFLPLVAVLTRRLSRPLELLAAGADKIAGGNYGVTIELSSNREIETLARSFNRMSRELKENYKKQMEQIALLEEQKQEIAVQNEELAEANARLELLSITDQLTGAYNRRYIMREMEQELAVAIRHGLPLSVIMVDIDHFKNINDTYGHQAGDDVLKEVVQVLSNNIRTSDILGRYGGEEFVIIAPLTGLQEALVLAERLRETVSGRPFATSAGALRLTISLGVAVYDGNADPGQISLVDRLLAQADEEMYRAKARGRNQVSPSLPEAGTAGGTL